MRPDDLISFPLFGDGFIFDLPRFFTLFGFNIYYYGLFITAGYALAGLYLIKRRELFGLTKDNILDLLLIAIPCGLIGARLYFMIFNYQDFFAPGQWGNILRFRDGGLAVYGGIIASGLVFIIYSRSKKMHIGNLLDAAGFGLFIGQAVGRWGNFINREAFGVETDMPWKMGLTSATGIVRYYHPAFLYESLWNIAGLLIIHIFSKKSKTKYPGQYFLFYVAWYGLGRFMIEGLRTDSLMIPGTELRASQWLAAMSFLTAITLLIYFHVRKVSVDEVVVDSDSYDADEDDDDDVVEDEIDEDVDAEDAEAAEDLAELDGASEEEVADEALDDDVDAEDEEAAEDLAEVDGATASEVENEPEEEIEEAPEDKSDDPATEIPESVSEDKAEDSADDSPDTEPKEEVKKHKISILRRRKK